MSNEMLKKLILWAALTAGLFISNGVLAVDVSPNSVDCKIRVFQSQQEIVATVRGQLPSGPAIGFILAPEAFDIEVSPIECAPSMATPSSGYVSMQIAKSPILYSQRIGFLYATVPEDEDKLLWLTRSQPDPQFMQPPDKDSFSGKQYQQLCDELKYCPGVYPLYSAASPFKEVEGKKSVAHITRIDNNRTLQDAQGKSMYNVIYTLWRALPSQFPMAPPEQLLFRANFVKFEFMNTNR